MSSYSLIDPNSDPRSDLRLFARNRVQDITKALYDFRVTGGTDRRLLAYIIRMKNELCDQLERSIPMFLFSPPRQTRRANTGEGNRSRSRSRSRKSPKGPKSPKSPNKNNRNRPLLFFNDDD